MREITKRASILCGEKHLNQHVVSFGSPPHFTLESARRHLIPPGREMGRLVCIGLGWMLVKVITRLVGLLIFLRMRS